MLSEVFELDARVRGEADRLAAQGNPALAVPFFARMTPGLELAYEASDLSEGGRHRRADHC